MWREKRRSERGGSPPRPRPSTLNPPLLAPASSRRRSWRGSARSNCSRGPWSRASSRGATAHPYTGFSTESPNTAVQPGRRPAPPRLALARPDRPLLHQEVPRRHQRPVPHPGGRERLDALRDGRGEQAPVRAVPGRGLGLPRQPPAGRGGPDRLRPGGAHARPGAQPHRAPADGLRPRPAVGAGERDATGQGAARGGRADHAGGIVVVVSDMSDEPAAIIEALQHLRFKGNDVISSTARPQRLEFNFGSLSCSPTPRRRAHACAPDLLADGYGRRQQTSRAARGDGGQPGSTTSCWSPISARLCVILLSVEAAKQ